MSTPAPYVRRWALWFCEPDDLLTYEANLAEDVPRAKWPRGIDLAMDELQRRLRASKSTRDAFEMGRIGVRSREALKAPCAAFALYYLYDQEQTYGEAGGTGRIAGRAAVHLDRGINWLTAEMMNLDYDLDGDGTVQDSEGQRPMATVFIRG